MGSFAAQRESGSAYVVPGGTVTSTIAKRYGRLQGLLRHSAGLARHFLGQTRPFINIQWEPVERFVFVCQGNICRSPYAEARAKKLRLPARSFGLNAGTSKPANPFAVMLALRRGVDLGAHSSAPASCFAVRKGDLLVGMEWSHASSLLKMAQSTSAQVTLLGLWSSERRPHLEDPYGLSEAYFDTCFDLIDSAVEQLAKHWWARHAP